jgi:hypothetical protein
MTLRVIFFNSNLLFLEVIYETSFMMLSGIAWAVTAGIIVFWKRKLYLRRAHGSAQDNFSTSMVGM